ncbi:hypothetical protein NN561_011707 [Cricetulus griseus]
MRASATPLVGRAGRCSCALGRARTLSRRLRPSERIGYGGRGPASREGRPGCGGAGTAWLPGLGADATSRAASGCGSHCATRPGARLCPPPESHAGGVFRGTPCPPPTGCGCPRALPGVRGGEGGEGWRRPWALTVTSEKLCRAQHELHFQAATYLCLLRSVRQHVALHQEFHGKGERSVEESAGLPDYSSSRYVIRSTAITEKTKHSPSRCRVRKVRLTPSRGFGTDSEDFRRAPHSGSLPARRLLIRGRAARVAGGHTGPTGRARRDAASGVRSGAPFSRDPGPEGAGPARACTRSAAVRAAPFAGGPGAGRRQLDADWPDPPHPAPREPTRREQRARSRGSSGGGGERRQRSLRGGPTAAGGCRCREEASVGLARVAPASGA